jgi:hypothetical protein
MNRIYQGKSPIGYRSLRLGHSPEATGIGY